MKADNKHPAPVQGHGAKEAPKTQAPAKPQPVAHPPAQNHPAAQKNVAPVKPKPAANPHAEHNTKVAANAHPEKQKQEQAPKQKQTQQQQQQQPAKQQPVVAQKEAAGAKLEVKRTIKLPQMLTAVEEDKQNKKVSFILDKTGNAFTFFKYKGTTIDVSDMVIQEHTNGKKHEDNVETARKQIVCSLNIGDNFVISTDIATTNLSDFFKSDWYIPESIFSYEEIVNPKYFRQHLLKPDEDHDGFGNKGNFYPKDSLSLVLLYTLKDKDAKVDFEEHLTKLGLAKLKDRFAVTIIDQ